MALQFAVSFLISEDDFLLVIPTSKTIYEVFEGKEFPDDDDDQTYIEWVRGFGVGLRKQFFDKQLIGNYLDLIEQNYRIS